MTDPDRQPPRTRLATAHGESLIERLTTTLESITDGFVTVDRDWKLNYLNAAAEQLFGIRREDVLGQSIWDAFPEETRAGIFGGQLESASSTGKPSTREALHEATGAWYDVQVYPSSQGMAVYFRDVTARRQETAAVRAFALRVEDVQLAERSAIARELHDEIGQAVTALRMDASRLGRMCSGNPTAVALIDEMIAVIADTQRATHTIAMALHPMALDDLGLAAAIELHAGHVARRANLELTLDLTDTPDIGRAATAAAYRVLQESLTNVVRHAQATSITIRLAPNGSGMQLQVRDDGVGIPIQPINVAESLGLLGMRERAAALGGTVTVTRGQPCGTVVDFRLPLPVVPA